MVQEGANAYLFGVPVTYVRHTCKSVSARVNEERLEGDNIATYLPSILLGQRGNLNDYDMNELQEQGFDVEDDNLTNPENVPDQTPVVINAPPFLN